MGVLSFQDFEKALLETQERFHKEVASLTGLLDKAVNLFHMALTLVSAVADDSQDEVFALHTLVTGFRRVLASIVLLENGLEQEAPMVLRNALECMLISIDIMYSSKSLKQWKETIEEELVQDSHWYFTAGRVIKRIKSNKNGDYPDLEIALATHTYEQWTKLSALTVHLHSYKQVHSLVNRDGYFRILGLKSKGDYEKDFLLYQGIIFDIVVLLMRIPRYKEMLKSKELSRLKADFTKAFLELKKELSKQSVVISFGERLFG